MEVIPGLGSGGFGGRSRRSSVFAGCRAERWATRTGSDPRFAGVESYEPGVFHRARHTAFSRLLCLPGVHVRKVVFEPDRVVVEVALRRRRLCCPLCDYTTPHRHEIRRVESGWRHLDLGVWPPRAARDAAAALLSRARGARRGRKGVRPHPDPSPHGHRHRHTELTLRDGDSVD